MSAFLAVPARLATMPADNMESRQRYPWYASDATTMLTNPVTGSNYTSLLAREHDSRHGRYEFVPSISLTASTVGDTQIVASVSVSGGKPPYTYLWTGSDPAVSSNTGASINYTPECEWRHRHWPSLPRPAIRLHCGGLISSTGFVLQSNTNLASSAWTPVVSQMQTNNGIISAVLNTQSASAMFFRLALASQTLPVTETVAVTVTMRMGCGFRQIKASAFRPDQSQQPVATLPTARKARTMYGLSIVIRRLAEHHGEPAIGGGAQAFLWTKFNSWPGDFGAASTPSHPA